MPQATQIVDSFHVVQLLNVRCAEKRESAEKHKAACSDEIHMAQEEGGARSRQDPSQGGTRLPDGRGAAGCLLMRRQTIGRQGLRAPLLVDGALCRGRDEGRGKDAQEGAGDLELVGERIHQLVPGRPQFCRPVRPQRRQGLQERRLLQDDDLAQAGPSGLHGPEAADMRYPLETAKSRNLDDHMSTCTLDSESDVVGKRDRKVRRDRAGKVCELCRKLKHVF